MAWRKKMTIRKAIIMMILIGLAAAMAPARGAEENYRYSNGRNDAAESFTGTFVLEDGQYAVLETTDGEHYYLVPDAPIVGDLPQDGDELAIEAFRSPATPNTLKVVSATVNGVSITPDRNDTLAHGRNTGHHYEDFRDGPGRNHRGFNDRDRGFGNKRGGPGDNGRGNGRYGWGNTDSSLYDPETESEEYDEVLEQ